VTPAENAMSHEALRIVSGGDPNKGFYPGFCMAVTDWGETPAPQDMGIVRQALAEKSMRYCQGLHKSGKITAEQLACLNEDAIASLVKAGERIWAPIRI